MLPAVLSDSLRAQLELVKLLHRQDLAEGNGAVYLPFALDRKYPGAAREWAWQYVFASGNLSVDPRSGVTRRHHIDEKGVQRAMKQAVRDAGISKPATPHTLRHYVSSRTMSRSFVITAPAIGFTEISAT